MRPLLLLLPLFVLSGCGLLTDPATHLAFHIEATAKQLGREEGARHTIIYRPPKHSVEPGGTYTVQLDKVGALIVWYKDAGGQVTDRGATSYHTRFVDTPETAIVDKASGARLTIKVTRRNGRAVITGVH